MSVKDIPIPEDLDLLDRLEFEAFVDTVSSLEDEYITSKEAHPIQAELSPEMEAAYEDRKEFIQRFINEKVKILEMESEMVATYSKQEKERFGEVLKGRMSQAYAAAYQSMVTSFSALKSSSNFDQRSLPQN